MLTIRDLLKVEDSSARAIEGRFGLGFVLVNHDFSTLPGNSFSSDDSTMVLRTIEGFALPGSRDQADAVVHQLCPPGKSSFMITVGRTSRSMISLPHPNISKLQAFFQFNRQENCFQITDPGSLNGTRIDGKAVDSNTPQSLKGGELIRFGKAITGHYHTPESLARHLMILSLRDRTPSIPRFQLSAM